MRSPNVEDIKPLKFGLVHDFHAVWRDELPRTSGRFAAGVRLVRKHVRMAEVDQRPCPVLKRNIIDMNWRVLRRARLVAVGVDRQSSIALPQALLSGNRP